MIQFVPKRNIISLLSFTIALFCFASCTNAQDISVGDRVKLKRIKSMVDKAGELFKKKDYSGSAKAVRSARELVVELAESGESAIIEKLKNDHERIAKAQKLLKGKGQKFDELKSLDSYLKSESDPAEGESMDSDSATEEISFVKQVAPIIIEHCGSCHIDRSVGRYSAATYESLKKGSRKGTAVRPRNVEKSRMVALITEGEMPPEGKGTPVPEDKLKIIKDWIEQGAKFDGNTREKKAPLTSYVSTDSADGKTPTQGSSRKSSRKGRGKISSLGGGEDVPQRGGGG